MEFHLDLLEERARTVPGVSVFRRDKHLASPLLKNEIDYIRRVQHESKGLKKEHIALLDDHTASILQYNQDDFQADMMRVIAHCQPYQSHKPSIGVPLAAAWACLEIGWEDWLQGTLAGPGLARDLSGVLTTATDFWYQWRSWWIEHTQAVCSTSNLTLALDCPFGRVMYYGNLCVVHLTNGKRILGTYSMMLAVKMICSAHFTARFYASCCDLFSKYRGASLYKETDEVLKAGLSDLLYHRGDAHLIYKALPSLAIARVLKDHEHVCDLTFSDAIERDVVRKFPMSQLAQYFWRPVPTDTQARMLLELSGLWKSWGFPVLDLEASATRIMSDVSTPPSAEPGAGERVRRMFLKMFCKEYYRQNHSWPPVTMGRVPDHIRHAVTSNTWPERESREWHPDDFAELTLRKCLDFDYFVDPTDLLTDKAISGPVNSWTSEFDSQAYRTFYGCQPPRAPDCEKRLLLAYLRGNPPSVREVIDYLQEHHTIMPHCRIQVGVPKEREFKKDNARIFVKLPYEMRAYQTATEANIATGIFPFIKGQSMTMGEKELLQTLIKITSPFQHFQRIAHVFISVDFRTWCSTMSHVLCGPTFEEFDNLFGLVFVYYYTHLFSPDAVFLFQDRFRPPPASDQPGSPPCQCATANHLCQRWFEGLRQKGWTLITTCLIARAAFDHGTNASLLGQGDNQVIVLAIPEAHGESQESAANFAANFIRRLVREATIMGMEVKPEETWSSSVLNEYSKGYHLYGSDVSRGLKKAAHLGSETNDGLVTLSNEISSIFSGALQVASVDPHPAPAYLLSCMIASQELDACTTKLTAYQLAASLLVTRELGGLPTLPYSAFCYRGVSDPLTLALSVVRTSIRVNYRVFSEISKLLLLQRGPGDLKMLIKDPYSLNIRVPMSAENQVRALLRRGLPEIVTNREIAGLFGSEADRREAELVEDLSRLSPMNPVLANYIYTLTNVSLRDRLLGRFSNSRSVRCAIQPVCSLTETDLANLIRDADRGLIRHLRACFSQGARTWSAVFRIDENCCLTLLAQELRERTWDMPVVGVTMAAPQEQMHLARPRNDSDFAHSIAFYMRPVDELLSRRGPYEPYIGSDTRVKTRKSSLEILDTYSMVTNLKRAIRLGPWVSPDQESQLAQLLRQIVTEKTTIDLDILKDSCGRVVGGSVAHRLRSEASAAGSMINGLINFSSNCLILTDCATAYAKSADDYTICFQSIMLSGISRLAHLYEAGVDVGGHWLGTLSCQSCTKLVPPDEYAIPATSYQGLRLPMVITELTMRRTGLAAAATPDDPRFKASVIYGAKMASYLHGWTDTALHTIPEAEASSVEPPAFLHLTELARLDVRVLVQTLSARLWAFHACDLSNTLGAVALYRRIFKDAGPLAPLASALVRAGLHPQLVELAPSEAGAPPYEVLGAAIVECLGEDVSELTQWIWRTPDQDEAAARAVADLLRQFTSGPLNAEVPIGDEAEVMTSLRGLASKDNPERCLTSMIAGPRLRHHGPYKARGPLHSLYLGALRIGLKPIHQELASVASCYFNKDVVTLDDPDGMLLSVVLHSGARSGASKPPAGLAPDVFHLHPKAVRLDKCRLALDEPLQTRLNMGLSVPQDALVVHLRPSGPVRQPTLELLFLEEIAHGSVVASFPCSMIPATLALVKPGPPSRFVDPRSTLEDDPGYDTPNAVTSQARRWGQHSCLYSQDLARRRLGLGENLPRSARWAAREMTSMIEEAIKGFQVNPGFAPALATYVRHSPKIGHHLDLLSAYLTLSLVLRQSAPGLVSAHLHDRPVRLCTRRCQGDHLVTGSALRVWEFRVLTSNFMVDREARLDFSDLLHHLGRVDNRSDEEFWAT
ncbi:TPA_asm: hypothetical protein [Macroli virus]|nr:TPA_asm: hypothetical protein [Macroli virus]